MPDIKDMEGPVKFKKGVVLYFDPKKDMFYDPKKKKYMSEKDILALGEETELGQELNEELQTDFEKSSFLKAYKGVLKMDGKEVWTSLPAQYKSSADAVKAAKHFKSLLDKHGYKMVSGSLEASDKAKKMMDDYDEKNAKYGKPSTTMGEEVDLFEKSEEYQKFFQSALKKFGIDSPAELDDKKKKEFFDYVDKNWEGENEEDEEESIEELSLEEAIEEAKEWKVGAPVFIVISYHTNGKHSTTVIRKKDKAIKFAKDEEYHEDDVKGTVVLDMKVGKFINKDTGEYIKEENTEERIQEMFDLGDKVKRKDGSEEGEVIQRRTDDKSVGGRYKLKLKNGSRSKWINGNSLELVEQFSKKMEKYVDACGKDFTNWK